MAIAGQIPGLNGASFYTGEIATGASLALSVGKTYTIQALTAAAYVGFGVTGAAALLDAAATKGELLALNAAPRIFLVTDSSVAFVGCVESSSGGKLRIRETVTA